MANADVRRGLQPVRHRNGAPYNGAVNYYYVAGDVAALFKGDPVVKTGESNESGITVPGAGFFAPGTLPEVTKATAGDGNAITGVIVSVAADPDGLGRTYNPANNEAVVAVCDDPDVIFETQCSVGMTAASVGLNGNLVYTHGGDTINGISGAEVSSGALATTATFQLKVMRIVNRGDVETGTNAKVEVLINNHSERAGVAGV